MAPIPRRRRAAGFTIGEVLAALAILTFVFISSISALSVGFKMLEEARASTLASQILQSQIENIRVRSWAEVEAMAADPSYRTFPIEIDSSLAHFPKFECACDFHPVSGYESVMKQVMITVAWTTQDGRSRTRRYTTLVAKDGISDFYYRAP